MIFSGVWMCWMVRVTPSATFASEPPAGQLCIASQAITNFTANLISSVAKMVSSNVFSTGGDELCYTQDNPDTDRAAEFGQDIRPSVGCFPSG